MAKCRVCDGAGRLLHHICPLCDGVIGWPEHEPCDSMSFDLRATVDRGSVLPEGLSVLSWNVFNPDTIGLATMENRHYNHLLPEERFWEHRFPKIMQEIRAADAAVVCLQEINIRHYAEIKEAMAALGYNAFTHKKMQRNSLAIFFKQKFLQVWEKHVKVKGFEKSLAIGLRDGSHTLAVVTCHLEGHPEKASDRVAQLEKTFTEIEKLPHNALVIAGDFNAPLVEDGWKNSAVTAYMCSGEVPTGTTEWGYAISLPATLTPHGHVLASAYAPTAASSICLHGEGPALIDHIWFSSSLNLVGVRNVFFDKAFQADVFARGLPNLRNPSDHLPLGAVFHWT
mmetsp:Transcript_1394/g.3086  ORF Transcript_1394/g.3086 Transcript_1394/m.3086 type:complete len:340 (-) Transcript_1394:165-1184(-)